MQTTLLRLELQADNIRYVKHVAKGELTDLKLEDLGTVNILSVSVTNTDKLTAGFTLRIDRCVNASAAAIFQPKTIDLTINPQQSISQNFTVRMADASESDFNCMITLLDAELTWLDERNFNVTLKEIAQI